MTHINTQKRTPGRPPTGIVNTIRVVIIVDQEWIDLIERVRGKSRGKWIRTACENEARRQIGQAESPGLES